MKILIVFLGLVLLIAIIVFILKKINNVYNTCDVYINNKNYINWFILKFQTYSFYFINFRVSQNSIEIYILFFGIQYVRIKRSKTINVDKKIKVVKHKL